MKKIITFTAALLTGLAAYAQPALPFMRIDRNPATAAMGGAENVPEPAPDPAPVAVPAAEGAPQASAEGSIPTETKLVCTRYMAGGYEMDASILGGELSVILHSDGSFGFNMLGNEVAGLAWTWEGNEAVVDYFGAGQLRLTPLEDGTVSMNFLDTMTYILAVP